MPAQTPPSPAHLRIFRYTCASTMISKSVPPKGIDYLRELSIRLHPRLTMVQGELQRVEYYDMATGGDIIISEDHVYTRDATDFAEERSISITWFREDGAAHPEVKVRHKLYTPQEAIVEGKRRRSNVADELQMTVAGALILAFPGNPEGAITKGRKFMRKYATDIDLFISASDQGLYDSVVADTGYPWLEKMVGPITIRLHILNAINIWGL